MSLKDKGVLVKTQCFGDGNVKRLTIPRDTTAEYFKRIVHTDGRIEFIPQMFLDVNVEGVDGKHD